MREKLYLCGRNKPNPTMATSYRPHNPGHDYYEAGAYLITLVVSERERCLSALNNNAREPAVELTAVGSIVHEEWLKTEAIQNDRGRHIETRCQVCMPDHWHGVIIVKERMDKSLGYIIQCFKSACTARWRREVTGYADSSSLRSQLIHMGPEKRAAYYATRPRIERPLFDDNYDDTICQNEGHLEAMRAYVADNPRRAVMRKLLPQFMQRCLHVSIDGRDYAAFGNLFLLRWVRKLQVFCHRKARLISLTPAERADNGLGNLRLSHEEEQRYITPLPYETTTAFQAERQWLMDQVMEGATVLVTPGISRGEALIKTECLERGIPLIHLQKEAIGPYWKPERKRFEACCNGSLLILAPWDLDAMGATNGAAAESDYARFHNLNKLAEQICAFTGAARILAK